MRAFRQSSVFLARRPVSSSRVLKGDHGAPATHRDTEQNNDHTPFEFSAENYAKIDAILAKYPPNGRMSAIMPLLDLAQRQNANWLPLSAMNKVAKIVKCPPMAVYEVATFYTMYNREPVGKHFLQLCTTTPCMYGGCGSKVILETMEKHLGIKAGETTPDGLFTLIEVECLGACVNAPMLQMDADDYFENLTPETVVKLLDDLKAGKKVTPGPQNGQKCAEGPQGKTTLFDKIPPPSAPNLDKPVAEKKD